MIVTRKHLACFALSLAAVSVLGIPGCVLSGDASLGSDGDAKAGAASTSGGASTAQAGKSSTSGGKSGSAGSSAIPNGGSNAAGETAIGTGNTTSEAGAATSVAGETGAGGANSDKCDLPIDPGPCDAAIFIFAYDKDTGQCRPFTYGGCEGNANRFDTLKACHEQCQNVSCPDYLQTDTVYTAVPLNRPERTCIAFDDPIKVSCSMLLNPSLTVPTNYGQNFCVKKGNDTFYAGTTLPKADGWEDCSAEEAKWVNQAYDCKALP
jgi:hypothetical protein